MLTKAAITATLILLPSFALAHPHHPGEQYYPENPHYPSNPGRRDFSPPCPPRPPCPPPDMGPYHNERGPHFNPEFGPYSDPNDHMAPPVPRGHPMSGHQLGQESRGFEACPSVIIVRPGLTLYRVAKMCKTSVQALMVLNNLPDANIQAGQRLYTQRSR